MRRVALVVPFAALTMGVAGCATTSQVAATSSVPIVDGGSSSSAPLPSSSPTTSAAEGSTTSSDGTFAVLLPSGWKLANSPAGQVLSAKAASAQDSVVDTLTVLSVKPASLPALPDVASSGELQMRQAGGRVSMLPARTVGGEPAVGYAVQRTAKGADITQLQYYVIHGDHIFTVTTTAATSQKAQLSGLTAALLDSWSWAS